jgi:hypothetical protein
MWQVIRSSFKNLWFENPKADTIFINDVAVKIRAGLLLFIPIYMSFTLYEAVFIDHWIVDGNTAVDTYDTDWDENIIYSVNAIKATYDYTIQTWVLLYALFEMLAGMFVFTSRFSPAIWLSTVLAHNQPAVWKPLTPKRFAWTIGATFISVCLIYFNPEIFAHWVNTIAQSEVLVTTENYMSAWIPLTLVWICFGFMWLEAILGFCVGCKVHALMVKLGIFKEECYECNNIDWDEIARKHKEKLSKQGS